MRFYRDKPQYSQAEIATQVETIKELTYLPRSVQIEWALNAATETLNFMLTKNKRWHDRQGK